jgi:ACR3 family arsenite transporter
VIASGLPRGTSMALGLWVCAAMLAGTYAAKICRPQWIHAVIYVALFLMLYPPMLDVDLVTIRRIIFEPWPVAAALFLNFLVSPLLIFGLAQLFVETDEWRILVGIVLYGMVPGGGMAPAFTGMLKGNVSLSVTIAAMGSLFSLGIVPLWAKCLIGPRMTVPALLIFQHLCFIVVIPLVLAVLTRRVIVATNGESIFLLAKQRLKALSGLGLCLLVFTMSLLYGDRVLTEPVLILKIACPVFAFLSILFVISSLLGNLFHSRYEEAVALTLSTTAKNNAISMALAFSTFGADVGLVNAIAGPLVQLPILLGFVALKKIKTTNIPAQFVKS